MLIFSLDSGQLIVLYIRMNEYACGF